MKHLMIAAALGTGLATAGMAASTGAVPAPASSAVALTAGGAGGQVWLAQGKGNGAKGNAGGQKKAAKGGNGKGGGQQKQAKGNSGNGQQKAKGNGRSAENKPGKSDRKQAAKADKKQAAKTNPGQAKKAEKAVNRSADKRPPGRADMDRRAEEILRVSAPSDRDMLTVLAGAALALAGPQLVVADTPVEELITYRNCPPGLAKKTPACVPPGLAKQGVTQDQWLGYDDAEYDRLWLRQRDDYLRNAPTPTENLLLQSAQIARLFGLDPAPNGQRYALIDGMPVLLDEQDYTGLLLINELAQVADLGSGVSVAPTAALTQAELTRLYRLPTLGDDSNYAVLNGQVIRLSDSQYETLQLIRIARAVL
ncbi:hypothetical protein BOO69_10460 [Sulfitobacter alexandrii]|uniref:Uncharacterized protein n=1 Tax=Sulfitobacter alexandrii TaxID=1917485 RepID=A0A1J0WHK3_9RHOB|nr:hypothetical protein [Sulfitobacter alexandrii]APE43787.1 hypothetical protein BOO69_10460 [Sulfitobacter alexandrii]